MQSERAGIAFLVDNSFDSSFLTPYFNSMKKILFISILLSISFCSYGSGRPGNPISLADYPKLESKSLDLEIAWRKDDGHDFSVFFGSIEGRDDMGIVIYEGFHPDFQPNESAAAYKEQIGAYEFTWYRRSDETNDLVSQTALVPYQK